MGTLLNIGTLLNRRRYMSGGGSSPLPYDAEIEYLEGTGTQYIDTGIKIVNGILMEYVGAYGGWCMSSHGIVGI